MVKGCGALCACAPGLRVGWMRCGGLARAPPASAHANMKTRARDTSTRYDRVVRVEWRTRASIQLYIIHILHAAPVAQSTRRGML